MLSYTDYKDLIKDNCILIKNKNNNIIYKFEDVKNENISQLDVHFQGYLDEHEEKDPNSVKALLIMNHQNNKAPKDREPVKDTQINLAKRNGSLIIETTVLLKLLEEYRSGKKTREMIINMIKNSSGLLKME